MRAYIRAIRRYNDALLNGRIAGPNSAEIISILTEYTDIKDADVYRDMTPFAINPDGRVNVVSLRKDLEFFQERGYLSKVPVSVEAVVDESFIQAAVRHLGAYQKRGQ
jgi:NitT/TauT family transport system substrate-binding protein